jgi:hypothetical protein
MDTIANCCEKIMANLESQDVKRYLSEVQTILHIPMHNLEKFHNDMLMQAKAAEQSDVEKRLRNIAMPCSPTISPIWVPVKVPQFLEKQSNY